MGAAPAVEGPLLDHAYSGHEPRVAACTTTGNAVGARSDQLAPGAVYFRIARIGQSAPVLPRVVLGGVSHAA
jgi:hypothetical protein